MAQTDVFFSEKNEGMLQRVVYNDVRRRIGGDLNERQATRLMKTVRHYMTEVHRVKGDVSTTVLNKEVLAVALPDYISYLNRVQGSQGRSAVADIETGPATSTQTISGLLTDTVTIEKRSQMDITTAFSELQTSRLPPALKTQEPKDFRVSIQEDAPVSMEMFERIKADREAEAQAQAQAQARAQAQAQGQADFATATGAWTEGKRRADEEAEAAFAARERSRMEARAAMGPMGPMGPMDPPPDMRALILGDRQTIDRRGVATAAGNPTVALPTGVRESTGGLQQMSLTREPETMTYKEREVNLFVYSADRDWVNSTESRYNFSVNFDPSNVTLGSRLNPSTSIKFRNVVRIELVKAIMPGEGLDLLVTKTGTSVYDSSLNMNILSFPYIQVRIPELDTNVYGTNQSLDSSFGVLQYDANWVSDSGNTSARGYFAMIPKFLKCQRVYTPTPLATLQKLSFQFQRPDGSLLSTVSDTLDIARIYPSNALSSDLSGITINTTGGSPYQYDTTGADISGAAYYWLKTSTYFNHWSVSKGDRILVKNLAWSAVPAAGTNTVKQLPDVINTLQASGGLLVVDTGVISGTSFTHSYNKQGYANAIIVRGAFIDPTLTGATGAASPGGIPDGNTSGDVSVYLANTTLTSGRLLNLSHQVQVCMRVILREMDATGILRPDNL